MICAVATGPYMISVWADRHMCMSFGTAYVYELSEGGTSQGEAGMEGRQWGEVRGTRRGANIYIYIYIYICKEREREIDRDIDIDNTYTYIHIYIYI